MPERIINGRLWRIGQTDWNRLRSAPPASVLIPRSVFVLESVDDFLQANLKRRIGDAVLDDDASDVFV